MARWSWALSWVAVAIFGSACGAHADLDLAHADLDLARFATAVVAFEPGDDAGFGADAMPNVVLGPPLGMGELQGSLDVVALGHGGTITVELGVPAEDEEGPDLLVFENAFHYGQDLVFAEPARVEVSEDGVVFVAFPCDEEADNAAGCAGESPVFANAEDNEIDPTDPDEAGGDAFDLADVGLARAKFIRLTDIGLGDGQSPSAGFDLDAVASVHPSMR